MWFYLFTYYIEKDSPNCLLCNNKETQLHLFNNCEAVLKRNEWRHNPFYQKWTILWRLRPKTSKSMLISMVLKAPVNYSKVVHQTNLRQNSIANVFNVFNVSNWLVHLKLTLINRTNFEDTTRCNKIQQSMQCAHHFSCTIQLDPPWNFYPEFCWKHDKNI